MPSRSFPAYAVSVPTARGFVTELLDGWPGRLQETAALLVSELATNAVRHGSGQDFDISVRLGPGDDQLWVGVTDRGPGLPSARQPPVTDEHGRGLQLVGLLASRWGVRRARGSRTKTVWFELTGAQAHPEPDAPGGQEPRPHADSGDESSDVLKSDPDEASSASPTRPRTLGANEARQRSHDVPRGPASAGPRSRPELRRRSATSRPAAACAAVPGALRSGRRR